MKKYSGDDRWTAAGRQLRFCDPVRYVAVMRTAEKIIEIYVATTYGVLPPCPSPRNDNE